MLSVRRVLYPTDLSPSAEHAYGFGVGLAAGLEAEFHVLHVDLPDPEESRRRPTEEDLTPDSPPADLRVVRAIRMGESIDGEILAYCQENDIDLIVMGTHGRTGLGRLLMGSVAEKVVRTAPCPVVTVPARAAGQAISRILAAIDFSSFSARTLRHAIGLAAHYGAGLDVLHVLQDVTVPSAYGPELASLVTPDLENRSREALEALVADVDTGDVSLTLHITFGYPATEILRFASEHRADLIVVATHGLSGLEHFLIGSVADKVVRKAACPVLTVRAFGKSVAGDRDG